MCGRNCSECDINTGLCIKCPDNSFLLDDKVNC